MKKIICNHHFKTGTEYREYYIKNDKVYFIYENINFINIYSFLLFFLCYN